MVSPSIRSTTIHDRPRGPASTAVAVDLAAGQDDGGHRHAGGPGRPQQPHLGGHRRARHAPRSRPLQDERPAIGVERPGLP